jgi:hypothetical protein
MMSSLYRIKGVALYQGKRQPVVILPKLCAVCPEKKGISVAVVDGRRHKEESRRNKKAASETGTYPEGADHPTRSIFFFLPADGMT